MRRGIAFLCAVVAAGIVAAPATAAPTQIEFGSVYFNPGEVTVNFIPGENTFEWNRNDPGPDFHSITANGGNFGIGPGGFTDFDLRASAGTYPYYCINHGSGGEGAMVGVVAVRPISNANDDDSFEVIWADGDTQTGSTFEARWKKDGQNKWKPWGSFDANGRTFGKNDNPTDVKPSKVYLVQVRSRFPGTSKWSPKLTLEQAT